MRFNIGKYIFCSLILVLTASPSVAAYTNSMLTPYQYNMMEPYLNNTMRAKLKPKDSGYAITPQQAMVRTSGSATTPLADYVRPNTGAAKMARRVVARNAAGAGMGAAPRTTAPQAPVSARAAAAPAVGGRAVVSRSRSASRLDGSASLQRDTAVEVPLPPYQMNGEISPEQCLSNYTECMDNYCHRPAAKYDRCYCSAKLMQLDSEYKPAIDSLMRKIAILQSGGEIEGGMTQDEINDFWSDTFGGENSMASLDEALNIDWSTTESSVRGQNAFVAGDNYCKHHLTGCFYMSENMKSMYRTSIGQDCKKYETYLQKMKYGAEQIVDNLGGD
jgi:hypothetical protein